MTKWKAALLAVVISIALTGGCGRPADEAASDPQPAAEEESALTEESPADGEEMLSGKETPDGSADGVSSEPGTDGISSEPETGGESSKPETDSAVIEPEIEDAPVLPQEDSAQTLPQTDDDGTLCDGLTVSYGGQSYLMTAGEGGYTLRNTANGRLLSLDFEEGPVLSPAVETILERIAGVYRIAHETPYVYGDSQTDVPCEDGVISCDRLIARALWEIGSLDGFSFRDQPPHGMTIFSEDGYLTTHGFRRVTDVTSLQRGDIILYADAASKELHHTCILTAYNRDSGLCARYDAGITNGVPKFLRVEPIVESVLYNYDYNKSIVNVYRLASLGEAGADNSLAAIEKKEADPAELSQKWVVVEMTGDTVVLKPALYDEPGTYDRPVSEDELFFVEAKLES